LSAFADTSLLCALYRSQADSPAADRLMRRESGPVHVSSLVLFEFRHSVRLQAFRLSKDRTRGYSKLEAGRMLEILAANLRSGGLRIPPVEDWAAVYRVAEALSAQHTVKGGCRSLDVLHVATAVYLKSDRFLTFDVGQAQLAKAAGLMVRP
jgi:predicted nucleic acid-binding protein